MSDTGDFVGPEPMAMWTNNSMSNYPEDELLVRPEGITLPFQDLVGVYRQFFNEYLQNNSVRNPSLYMEYIPLSIMGTVLQKGVSPFYWYHILNPLLHLIWLGGGGCEMHCRVHFDSLENIMAVTAGTKIFKLYSPTQSYNIYGDSPLRPAGLRVKFSKKGQDCTGSACKETYGFEFSRPVETIGNESSAINSYTPADLLNPNYKKFPLLKELKGFNCTVNTVSEPMLICYFYI